MEAFFVRPAAHDGTGHLLHDFLGHRSLLGEINKAGDATHGFFIYFGSPPSGDRFLALDQGLTVFDSVTRDLTDPPCLSISTRAQSATARLAPSKIMPKDSIAII